MNLQVIFNIPNSIGYVRLILLIFSVYSPTRLFIFLYSLSSILDFFDGYTARLYNQSSKLGGCLDMITDRISTVIIGLRIVRDNESKSFYNFISLYILIDMVSHFMQCNVSALKQTNHKINTNFILQIYYNKYFLFPICFLSEAFFICTLYLTKQGSFYNFLYYCTFVKMLFHIVQLWDSICKLSDIKNKNYE